MVRSARSARSLEAKAVEPKRSARNHLLALAASNGISRRRVDEVIGLVGLDEVAGRAAGGFSLGMSQRLGHSDRFAGRPGDHHAGRTDEWSRPGRDSVDAELAAVARRSGPHRVRVLAPDERNVAHRPSIDHHRPRPPDTRLIGRRTRQTGDRQASTGGYQ